MEIGNIVSEIKNLLQNAQSKAYQTIHFMMVEAYWQIGKRIVEEEQAGKDRADYGKYLIKELAKRLTNELGTNISTANLKNFRQFYLVFPQFEIGYTVRSQLSWSHYRAIMRVENIHVRNYYIQEAAEQNWSSRQLERNIKTLYYERILSSQDKQNALKEQAKMEKYDKRDFIKDPFVLEFLGMESPKNISERELETAIVQQLKQFLLELGKGFSFVGEQYRITTETKHFYIDLVFYNFYLKCFVLIDLKIDELTHQDIGQMDMYVRLFEDTKKIEGDNPTIGIILCTEKDDTVVKYSVLEESKQLFAAKYLLYLPTEAELRAELEREKRLFLHKKQHDE